MATFTSQNVFNMNSRIRWGFYLRNHVRQGQFYCVEHAPFVSSQFQSMYIPLGQGIRDNKDRRKQWSPTKFLRAKGLHSLDKVTKCLKSKQTMHLIIVQWISFHEKNLKFFVKQILVHKNQFSPGGVEMSIESPFVVVNHSLSPAVRT